MKPIIYEELAFSGDIIYEISKKRADKIMKKPMKGGNVAFNASELNSETGN